MKDDKSTTIISQAGITIDADIDLGTGNLILTAGQGSGTGDITFGASRVLDAANIMLEQDSAFTGDTTAPATFTRTGTLTLRTEAAQIFQAWMDDGTNPNLTVQSEGNITINGDIDVGSGALTLEAGFGTGTGSFAFSSSAAVDGFGRDDSSGIRCGADCEWAEHHDHRQRRSDD